jgi:hypothetical protein
MTRQIMGQRSVEFDQMQLQITETLRSNQVYETEEQTRK